MGRPDMVFCEPASGPVAIALRAQDPDAPTVAIDQIDDTQVDVCVLDAGNDVATLTQMAAMLATKQNVSLPLPQIIAQVSDRVLRAAMEARVAQDQIVPRPIIVSADALLAAHVISRYPLFKTAFWRDQPKVHAVMIGFGPLGRALLDEIVLDGTADGLGLPLIDVITPDASAAAAALAQEMPEIYQSATINFIASDVHAWHALADLLAQVETSAPITAIFVLHENPDAVLTGSAAISELQERGRIAIAPIFIAGPTSAVALALTTPRREPRNLATSIVAIGGLTIIDDLLGHIVKGRDTVARRIHDAYEKLYAKQTAAGTRWDDLAETYRRANRRAARHLSQKLFAIGIDGDADPSRAHMVSPITFDRLIRPLAQSSVEDDAVRRLARLEHDRWCADRRLDGWVYGDTRDEQRRRHPSLVPFDDPRLTADEIDKDIAQLRFMFGSVVIPDETGSSVRLVIGILEQHHEHQPGIDAAAIRSRINDEPDRDIVLISPLLTAAEVSATSMLVADLDSQFRRLRLYVPQQLADGDGPHVPALALDERHANLRSRPETYIVPIGPAEHAPGDDWEQVGSSGTSTTIVADYVVEHADMLLSPTPQ